ncbi:MAG: class I SAM-dependent methyltransferase [Cytophagales bacterium]|nr:class I SAM-dependent methyltransferase [Cytophagales bacterium]
MKQVLNKTDFATEYEAAQNFNFLTKWLHSLRYKAIHKVFDQLSKEITDRPIKVFEIGSAYGRLYGLLNKRYNIEYTGIELYEPLYKLSLERYGNNTNARFMLGNCMDDDNYKDLDKPDIIIALETLEHIAEHDVVRLIERIATIKPGLFVCSVPVEIGPAIWLKNLGSFITGYTRHKEYTMKETFWAGFYKLDKLPPHTTGHKGFDWRWLAQTIRHNFCIQKIITFPLNLIPTGLASSVFIISKPRCWKMEDG